MKIIIADDNLFMRESIKLFLEQEKNIEVVACAANGSEAFKLCEKYMPHIVLMDIKMPGCDGIEATKLIKSKFNSIKIIILTSHEDEEYVKQALALGVEGYIYKDIDPADLPLIIGNVFKNLPVLHKKAFSFIKTNNSIYSSKPGLQKSEDAVKIYLARKELEIINLIVSGKTNKEISIYTNLSEGRIRNIISVILQRLDLKDKTQLALYAVKNKLADIESFNTSG